MKKRIIGALCAGTMLLASLAGCGAGTDTTNTSVNVGSEGGQGSEKVLRWAMWDKELGPYYAPLVEGFEAKHPGVKIEMVDLGGSDYSTVLGTQLTGSGYSFDVVSMKDVPQYTNLVNRGILEPLDDYIAKDGVNLEDYKGLTNQVSIEGKLYELPFRSDFWVIYYNKDVFDNAGIPYPSNDMTLDEYDRIARSLTVDTPGAEVYGAHYHTWRSAVQLFGILDGKHTVLDGNYDFLKPYYERVLAEQRDGVCQDYATLRTSNLHYTGAFAQGNIGMMNMGSWFMATLIEKIKSGEYADISNWGIVKYPHDEGVEPGSTLATITSLAIPTTAAHKDMAWEFVKFVTGKEGAEILANTGTIPAIMTDEIAEAIADVDGFPTDDASKEALQTSNLYLEMPTHIKSSEIETVLNEAHDNIMTENITVDEGIADMNEKISEILGQ